jgi:hypothetical protein
MACVCILGVLDKLLRYVVEKPLLPYRCHTAISLPGPGGQARSIARTGFGILPGAVPEMILLSKCGSLPGKSCSTRKEGRTCKSAWRLPARVSERTVG